MGSLQNKRDSVLGALERVLASPVFVRNPRSAAFLRFVVEQALAGNAHQLKETVIGSEVFSRSADYDPRRDPVVRMEAAKLRARLTEYYRGAGAADTIQFEVPKGGYVPHWRDAQTGSHRARWVVIALASALSALLIVAVAIRHNRQRVRPILAVLPFANLGGNPEDTFLCDGISDAIIRSLSTVEGLDVTSRTSSFAFRDSRLTTQEIGKRLGATVLLDGSVQIATGRLRVSAQLTHTTDGRQFWSTTYERALGNAFSIQEDIATSIATALRLKLGTGQRRYSDNPEAYQSYLAGRYALDAHKAPNALKHFEHAIAADTTYAPAYAGIADALLAMHHDLILTYVEMEPRARSEAEKSIQLDPMLSDGHVAMGTVLARGYNWRNAERELRRAIELNPNSAAAHLALGHEVLVPVGRLDEGLGEIRRSITLDPLSQAASQVLVWTLIEAGRYREAAEQVHATIAIDPSRPEPYLLLARALYLQGRNAEALTAMVESDRRARHGRLAGWLACAYTRAGQREPAERLLHETLENAYGEPLADRRMVQFYACLGERDETFEYLERMYVSRESALPHFLRYPELAWLRTDRRYSELVYRLGIEP